MLHGSRLSRFLVVLTLAVLPAVGCSPKTKMLKSWTAPDYQKESVKKILVLGVARQTTIRHTYEDTFVETLKKMGYEAVPSYLWVPDIPQQLDKEMLAPKIAETDVTHVLATRLVDEKTVQTYSPPTYATVGVGPYYPGWYGSYYSYWSTGYTVMATPGYVTETRVYSLETNIYDARTEKLIWTGITETWVADTPTKNIDAVISKVTAELRSKSVL